MQYKITTHVMWPGGMSITCVSNCQLHYLSQRGWGIVLEIISRPNHHICIVTSWHKYMRDNIYSYLTNGNSFKQTDLQVTHPKTFNVTARSFTRLVYRISLLVHLTPWKLTCVFQKWWCLGRLSMWMTNLLAVLTILVVTRLAQSEYYSK